MLDPNNSAVILPCPTAFGDHVRLEELSVVSPGNRQRRQQHTRGGSTHPRQLNLVGFTRTRWPTGTVCRQGINLTPANFFTRQGRMEKGKDLFSKLKKTLHVKKLPITRYDFLDDATRSGGKAGYSRNAAGAPGSTTGGSRRNRAATLIKLNIPPGKVRDLHLVTCDYDPGQDMTAAWTPADWRL